MANQRSLSRLSKPRLFLSLWLMSCLGVLAISGALKTLSEVPKVFGSGVARSNDDSFARSNNTTVGELEAEFKRDNPNFPYGGILAHGRQPDLRDYLVGVWGVGISLRIIALQILLSAALAGAVVFALPRICSRYLNWLMPDQ